MKSISWFFKKIKTDSQNFENDSQFLPQMIKKTRLFFI